MAGMDIGYAIRQRRYKEKPQVRYSRIADKVVELGRLGQKSGKGWYRYEPGDRTPRPDPAIDALIEQHRRELGIAPRAIDDAEIVERCIYALVNEGARILEEGIAARPVDIDMVWIHGYGFPAHEGGPMFWADRRGLDAVLADVERFATDDPRSWRPAPLLVRLAGENRTFQAWSAPGGRPPETFSG
jgi:3-hydroxyacyl-CoA dehydrogenase